jgi:subtilisin family serine protease
MRHRHSWFVNLASALVVLIASVGATTPTRTLGASSTDYVANEVLVKLNPLVDVLTIIRGLGLDLNIGPNDRLGTSPIYRLRITDGSSPLDKATALMQNLLVVYAEPNYIGQEPEVVYDSAWSKGDEDVIGYNSQWAEDKVRLPEAHTVSRGAGVTVAVLDTGVDPTHPALAGRLVPGFDFVGLDVYPGEEGVYGQDIGYGHGTHVAGLIALAAPEAKIMPLRILRPDGTGDSWLLAQAIRYAFAHRVGVINLSYSVKQRSRLIDEVLSQVTSVLSGAFVAAAAGNSGGSAPEYPAAEGAPGMLAVGASSRSDNLADFSTRGAWVSVAAPGERIVSSVPLASGVSYATWSGTSMAAPLTAGTAALVRSAYPNLKPAEVAQRIVATSAMINGPVPRRIDAAAAMGLPGAPAE